MTLDDTYDIYTKMSGKLSISMQNRSHMTNFGDLEAVEDLMILASDLCFTFLGVGSNPGHRISFFHIMSVNENKS